jgi:hypothetical protein
MPCRFLHRIALASALICLPTVTNADIAFTRIADTSTLIPGTQIAFQGFTPPSIRNGELAFTGGGGSVSEGVYSTVGGLHTVADVSTTFPGSASNFSDFGSSVSTDGSSVAFFGRSSFPQQGAFVGNGQIQVIVNQDTLIPQGAGTFTGAGPALIRDGQVAFKGAGASVQRGIYRTTQSGLARVADKTTSIPDWNGEFLDFKNLSFDGSQAAFVGWGQVPFGQDTIPGSVGVYSSLGGTLQAVADRNTTVPGGTGQMRTFSDIAADDGDLAFIHGSTDFEDSITAWFDGELQVLVNDETIIPDSGGVPFFSLGLVALSERNIVFGGADFSTDRSGIYALFDGALFTVIEGGDLLDGRVVTGLNFANEALDGNQFAFRANSPTAPAASTWPPSPNRHR